MISFEAIELFRKKHKIVPVVLIGAGGNARKIAWDWHMYIKYAIDNNPQKSGKYLIDGRTDVMVYDWQYLLENVKDDDVLLITPSSGYLELLDRLTDDRRFDNIEIHVLAYMNAWQWDEDRVAQSYVPFSITRKDKNVIPKTIHYFWFSDDPYPDKVKRCIDSWHKHCPDYKFKKWSLSNYITHNEFCNEALSAKQWAFASDYGRCDVIVKYGGVYLDTDVELIKPLDDLLYDSGFICFESAGGVDPGSGIGAVAGNNIFSEIRDMYEGVHFINDDGTYNKISIIRQYTDVLVKHGLLTNGVYQLVENVAVYPPLVLSPYSYRTGIDSRYNKSYGVHHWVSAWITEEERNIIERRKDFYKKIGLKKITM